MQHPYLKFIPSASLLNSKNPKSKLVNLFAENDSSLAKYELELMGILDMVDGLDHHYKNLKKQKKNTLLLKNPLSLMKNRIRNTQFEIHKI